MLDVSLAWKDWQAEPKHTLLRNRTCASGANEAPTKRSVDMLTTQLDEREIIREVRLRVQPVGSGAAYQKFDQPASHYALTGICAVVTLNGGAIASARVGVTGVGPKAYRPTAVEQALVGKPVDEEAIKTAVQSVADGIDVQGDIHASPEYRAHLARVLTRRAVIAAAGRVKG